MADKIAKVQQETFNPFTPEFGKVPAYFAGREQVLSDILSAFEEQTMNLCALFVGPRGCGKTALLTYLGNEASRLGWVVANVSATSGMLEDIVQRTEESASHLIAASSEKRLTGVNIAGIGGATWDAKSNTKANWRTRMNNLLERLGEADIG
ncbi:ATP-binding protein, partial [Adlercreutzia sp.]